MADQVQGPLSTAAPTEGGALSSGSVPFNIDKKGQPVFKATPTYSSAQVNSILANMEKMIEERTGILPDIARGMNLARATAAGPEAYRLQAKQDLEEEQNIQKMRMDAAAIKAAYEQNERLKQSINKNILGIGSEKGPTGLGGFMASVNPAIMREVNRLVNEENNPTAAREMYEKALLESSKAFEQARFNKASYEPSIEVRIKGADGKEKLELKSLVDILRDPSLVLTEKGAETARTILGTTTTGAPTTGKEGPLSVRLNNPGAMRDPKTGEFMQFKTREEGERALQKDLELKISGKSPAFKQRFGEGVPITPSTFAEVWSPATAEGNSPEKTGNYALYIANKLGIDSTAPIPNTPEAINLVKQAVTEFESGIGKTAPTPTVAAAPATGAPQMIKTAAPAAPKPAPVAPAAPAPAPVAAPAAPAPAPAAAPAAPAPAPVAAPAAPAPVAQKTIPEMRAEQAAAAEGLKTRATGEAKTSEEDRTEFVASIKPIDLSERKNTTMRIAELVKENPNIAGVISDPNVFNGIAKIVRDGISTPKGPINITAVEDAIFATLPSTKFKDEVQRRELASYLAKLELLSSRLISGQGSVSNVERTIIKDASVSIADPAENIYKRAKMMERRADLDKELGQIYRANKSAYIDFDNFWEDPKVQERVRAYENDLRNITREKVDIKRGKPAPAPKGGQTPTGINFKF